MFYSLACASRLYTSSAYAGLVTVNPGGQATLNVLSYEAPESLKVTDSVAGVYNTKISLATSEGKTSLTLGDKTLDVTNVSDSLIEVEERPAVRKLSISQTQNQFRINQNGIAASTSFPITVDPTTANISVTTATGVKYIFILPAQAFEILTRANYLDKLTGDVNLTESEVGEPIYNFKGEKSVNLFNLVTAPVPVEGQVSAVTGKVISMETPIWYKLIGFLFRG